MRDAALRGLITGLALSAGVLALRPSWRLGCWIASVIDPHSPGIYLDVH